MSGETEFIIHEIFQFWFYTYFQERDYEQYY